jgi:hypothetical protein
MHAFHDLLFSNGIVTMHAFTQANERAGDRCMRFMIFVVLQRNSNAPTNSESASELNAPGPRSHSFFIATRDSFRTGCSGELIRVQANESRQSSMRSMIVTLQQTPLGQESASELNAPVLAFFCFFYRPLAYDAIHFFPQISS